MLKSIKSALKKTAVNALFFAGCLLVWSCNKNKEPLAIYNPGDNYLFEGARLSQQGDTLQKYTLQLSIPAGEDSSKTFSVGLNSGAGVSHSITWQLTDRQTGQEFTSQKKVVKSDRKITLNLPDTGPMAFTKRMLPLVADLDMGKKSFVQVEATTAETKNKNQDELLTAYKATLTYPGDTVVFLPNSLRVVAKHYNAKSESARQTITSKFLFNKERGFIRMEYILPKNERLIFNLVPPYPEVITKVEEEKRG